MSLLEWIESGVKFLAANKTRHVEDDYYHSSRVLNRELKNISYLYNFR